MSIINFTFKWSESQEVIENFANELGYKEEIPNPAYERVFSEETGQMTGNGEPQLIANPEDRVTYANNQFKDFVGRQFFGRFATQQAQEIKQQEAQELAEAVIQGQIEKMEIETELID